MLSLDCHQITCGVGVVGKTQGCWLKNSDSSRDKSEGQATQTKEMKNATPTSINN